ncbi:Beta-carotene 3-hydroxylase 2 chloroplastic [Dissostichus eleginoides]|uniref:Beta-carotene 3-hydroxylase 2 chloroplastic n=1 Tax=Dissostichus eleginoides TaxID=100907 RepID=A0AAD9FCL1_DISEL|nr:Beta-carotene 3-hydroxylase 2 chloroplastic [Dissostichus eleginoides]
MIVAVQEVRGQKEQRSSPRCDQNRPAATRDSDETLLMSRRLTRLHVCLFVQECSLHVKQCEGYSPAGPLTLDLIETPSKQQPTDSSQNSGET